MKPTAIISLVSIAIVGIIVLIGAGSIVEKLDPDEIMVVQAPWSGTLTWHITPGVKYQGWGKYTKYKKRDTFDFPFSKDPAKNESLSIRFNDGGNGFIGGAISWEMPLDVKNLNELHSRYGSHDAIEQKLVRSVVEKTVYATGPTMSSTESYSARRNELLNYIDDQIKFGVYRTEVHQERQKDVMTNQEKTVSVVKLVKGADGNFLRQDDSPLDEFGIKTFNLVIKNIAYDERVEAQIQQQQAAFMQVQTAIAKAREAEQDAITVAERGKAEAAKAKWEQEVIKAREVTKAEQERSVAVTQAQKEKEVAKLQAEAAAEYKREQILRGEGEAARRKLVMDADGSLDKRLEAYVEVQKAYAGAIAGYQGSWVPSVVSGGTSGHGPAAAQQMIEALSIKALKDLGAEVNVGPRLKRE